MEKNKFERFIEKNLKKVVEEETKVTLGDRSQYIGASDIAGCLRKAYLSKIQEIEYSMKELLRFERGHLAENIVAKMLKGLRFKQQVEVVSKASNGFAIKSHLDFVVYDKKNKECVAIEVKSVSSEISEPYESHILQIQMQMGLLQQQCGADWRVRGYVFAINVNTGWHKAFRVEQNKALFDMAMSRANTLAEALKSGQIPDGEEQLYCSSCPFKGDCPAIQKGAEQLPDDVAEKVKKLINLKSMNKLINTEAKVIEKEILEFLETANIKAGKTEDTTIHLRIVKNSWTADTKLLKSEYPEIFEAIKKPKKGYSFVKII